jgi:hypothetical protein
VAQRRSRNAKRWSDGPRGTRATASPPPMHRHEPCPRDANRLKAPTRQRRCGRLRRVPRRGKDLRRQRGRRSPIGPRNRARRVPNLSRALGFGQDDDAQHARRLRATELRDHPVGGSIRRRSAALRTQHRHGVSELRAVPAHVSDGERRFSAVGAQSPERRNRRQGQARARNGALRAIRRAVGSARRPPRKPCSCGFSRGLSSSRE